MQGFLLGFLWVYLTRTRALVKSAGSWRLGKFQTPVTRLSIRRGKSRKRWPVAW